MLNCQNYMHIDSNLKISFNEGLNGGVALTVDGKILLILTIDG